jgi:hypothetical protein
MLARIKVRRMLRARLRRADASTRPSIAGSRKVRPAWLRHTQEVPHHALIQTPGQPCQAAKLLTPTES